MDTLTPPRLAATPFAPPRRRPLTLALIAAGHVLAVWALSQPAVRHAVLGAAPTLTVRIVPSPAPVAPQAELPLPHDAALRAPTIAPLPLPAVEVAAPIPVTAPTEPLALQPPPASRSAEAAVLAAPTPPAPPSPPPERQIAITQVEYLTPPVLTYPLAARRMREQGQADVRVRVDEQGQPSQVQLLRSSGSERLDGAALAAARATRFKPYTENGAPRAFWVVMPLIFELDN